MRQASKDSARPISPTGRAGFSGIGCKSWLSAKVKSFNQRSPLLPPPTLSAVTDSDGITHQVNTTPPKPVSSANYPRSDLHLPNPPATVHSPHYQAPPRPPPPLRPRRRCPPWPPGAAHLVERGLRYRLGSERQGRWKLRKDSRLRTRISVG